MRVKLGKDRQRFQTYSGMAKGFVVRSASGVVRASSGLLICNSPLTLRDRLQLDEVENNGKNFPGLTICDVASDADAVATRMMDG